MLTPIACRICADYTNIQVSDLDWPHMQRQKCSIKVNFENQFQSPISLSPRGQIHETARENM